MNISYNQLLVNKRRVKRRIKKKATAGGRCHHCSGAFRESDEAASCLMCGREKGHTCSNCLHAPEESLDQDKKLA
jgi:hypothetical protein